MKLESQVCSLELSKRLKELGVKQKSTFYWVLDFVIQNWAGKSDFTGKMEDRPAKKRWTLAMAKGEHEEIYSAFTVAELGEMLPKYFCSVKRGGVTEWACEKWSHGEIEADVLQQRADNEAECRAKMLIYLLGNKLIPVDEIKEL